MVTDLFNAPTEYSEVVSLTAQSIVDLDMTIRERNKFLTAIYKMFFDELGSEKGVCQNIASERAFRDNVWREQDKLQHPEDYK